ncbi:ATP-binding protein [Streptomyces sp. MBT27]|uniref:ATP-binding protein n=1 Tax=Streptomyces sp. MBT27 TaxID=1488356 RepID=UPI001F07C7E7|nr:ATP-binding protein [Streptomyces sp. MBT27]
MTVWDGCRFEIERKAWALPFMAEPRELAGLRRVMRLHLNLWGLPHVVEAAQLCVTELVTNVITHVGPDTPTTLAVSMNGSRLRIAVIDPDARALPTLLSACADDESGRGMALVEATAQRWGVILREDGKVTWCELATGLRSAYGHVDDPQVARVEALLDLYSLNDQNCQTPARRVTVSAAEKVTTGLIVDLLRWLRVHGRDSQAVIDRAWSHFENMDETESRH